MNQHYETPLPSWLVKAIVISIITAMIGAVVAWGNILATRTDVHEKRISVIEEHQTTRDKEIDKDLEEVKATTRRIEDKLDRALKRRWYE